MTARRFFLLFAATALVALAGAPAALATTFTVDSTAGGSGDTSVGDTVCEDGLAGTQCTLGAAVQEANATVVADTVVFAPALAGQTVQRSNTLAITQPLTIDGCSNDPNHAGPCTEIHTVGGTEMFNAAAAGVTIRGVALTGNARKLVATTAADNLVFKNNWVGFALDGTPDGLSGSSALTIQGDGATIGGTAGATGSSPADRNVISNASTAIDLSGDSAVIQGNYIGTNPTGGTGPFNGHGNNGISVGVRIVDSANVHQPNNNLIGGTASAGEVATPSCDGPCNVISNAGVAAINLDAESNGALTTFANSTTIRANYIGTDVSGSADLGNGIAINIARADLTQIGGIATGARNLIAGGSGSGFNGLGIRIVGGDDTSILNNSFGRGSSGQAIPNDSAAISVTQFSPSDQAVNGQIGGDVGATENVISNSGSDAILLGAGADNFTVGRNTGTNNGSGQAGDEFIDLVGTANSSIPKPVITAARRSTVAGTASDNTTIRIFATNAQHGDIQSFIGSTTSAANGSWSFTYPAQRALGERITVTQTDPFTGGDTSELATPVRTGNDGTLPTVFIESGPTGGETTTDSTPTYEFTSNVPTATFECRFDADAFAPCTSPFTPGAPLADGQRIFSVRANDAGQVGQVAGAVFTVDATAETVIDSGPAQNSFTNDPTPTFQFSSPDAGATFKCRVDGSSFAPCSGPGASHTPSSPLADGTHNFKVRATDALGNVDSTPAARSFKVDTVRPETTITSGPAAGSKINDTTPTFGFSSSEAGSTFACRVDGGSFGPCSGPGATHTTAALSDGQHSIRVRAIDLAGNADDVAAIRTFTVDTVAPDTTITSGPAAGSKINDPTPTFGFSSSESGSTFDCRIDGGAFAPCSGPGDTHTTAPLSDGQHTIRVRATDAAGNRDTTHALRTFTVDTVAPETTITSGPAAGSTTADSTPTFGFSSSESGSTFDCRIDGGSFAPCSGPGNTHTTAPLSDGQHTIRVRATDAAGNRDTTHALRTFTVDA